MLTPEQIAKFLESREVKKVEAILNDPNCHITSLEIFQRVRNYVMIRILIANGHRTGVLLALTPSALDKAALNPNGAIVTVSLTLSSLKNLSSLYGTVL